MTRQLLNFTVSTLDMENSTEEAGWQENQNTILHGKWWTPTFPLGCKLLSVRHCYLGEHPYCFSSSQVSSPSPALTTSTSLPHGNRSLRWHNVWAHLRHLFDLLQSEKRRALDSALRIHRFSDNCYLHCVVGGVASNSHSNKRGQATRFVSKDEVQATGDADPSSNCSCLLLHSKCCVWLNVVPEFENLQRIRLYSEIPVCRHFDFLLRQNLLHFTEAPSSDQRRPEADFRSGNIY